jgi:hypothetical protein
VSGGVFRFVTTPRKRMDMTLPDSIDSRPKWAFRLIAAGVLATLAATLFAASQSYASGKVEGVRAYLKHGTLRVQGSDGGQQVALRLKQGDTSVIQVDAGDNGSADFSFARADIDTIKVKMGDGNDSARIDDANGAFTNTIPTSIAGGDGNDTLEGGQVQLATTWSTAARARTPPTSAQATTHSAGITARART